MIEKYEVLNPLVEETNLLKERLLKILVINYEYPPIGGGGGVICRDIAEEISSMGHKVTVITSEFEGLEKYEIKNGVEIIRVPVFFRSKQNVASLPSMLSYVPSSISRASQFLNKESYDVINTHFAVPSGPAGNFISKKFKIPNILSIHGGDIFDPSKSMSPHKTIGLKQTVRRMLLNADRVVAQSSDTKKNASTFYNIERKIDIIPLGIKPNKFQAKTRKELGLPENKIIFVTVGRLIARKNLEELIDIIGKMKNDFQCELMIVGDGPEKENLQQKINSLNLTNEIKLLGRVSEELKFQYLNASDVYLSTAMHEGFGIVFLEAMECGLPVICYDRGGQIDFLRNDETGYLIKLGDAESFYKKLIYLLNSPNLLEKIGKNNKETVKKFYINNIAKQYLTIFEQAVSIKS
jgi:glycosyltransferase involved in cell wall biosynthesis